jgi:transcriptional regulator with XRE-family HTH domain
MRASKTLARTRMAKSLGHMRRQRANAPPLALLFRRARQQLGLEQRALAKYLDVTPRTLSRWEAGAARPVRDLREHVATVLENVEGETWRAIVEAMGLPLDAMLAKNAIQRAKLPPPPPPPEEPPTIETAPPPIANTPPPPSAASLRAALDDLVRATAEDLDITARRLRAALGNVLADITALGLSPAEAREHILHRARTRA